MYRTFVSSIREHYSKYYRIFVCFAKKYVYVYYLNIIHGRASYYKHYDQATISFMSDDYLKFLEIRSCMRKETDG